jgi:ribosomal protein L11 methyltransferase
MHTVVARLACDEPTARALAAALDETLDPDDTVCAAFADDAGRWQMAVYFRAHPDEDAVRALVRMASGDAAAAGLTFEPLAEVDWVAQSLAGLAPVRAGRFVVHGSHDRDDRLRVPANALAIEIEAALAFGTGHHGTTRGCLMALDDLAKRRHFRNVLDIGTGSGVLAIAAAKRLRVHVVGSDIDWRAVAAARDNARLNGVAPYITAVHAAGAGVRKVTSRGPYDLIFANILLGPLTRLAVPVRRLAAPRGRVVLSGLLPSHANAAQAIYRAQGLTLERRIFLEGWTTLILRRGR